MINKITYWKQLRIQRFERNLCTRCGDKEPTRNKICDECLKYCRERYKKKENNA